MYDNIKLTVIVLGDYAKKELDECIYSLIGQTHSLFELLIVLKGEGQITEEDLASYGDNRIRLVSAREDADDNRMFQEGYSRMCSASKYCVCVDGSDRVSVDYLGVMLSEMSDRNCDILCGGTVLPKENDDRVCNVPGVVWNKIYGRNIDWEQTVTETTQNSVYFRRNRNFKFFESERKFQWGYEHLKMAVLDPEYHYISFDIFDTLVQRPFYDPMDLFVLLDVEFEKYVSCNTSFSVIRRAGESELRRQYAGTDVEDVTLDEIYENIGRMFRIDPMVLHAVEEYEKKLEIAFAKERKSIKDIYQIVINAGKKVIFITDMYLDRATIETILSRNGYTQYERLYISSEERKLKGSGRLFDRVLSDLGVEPQHILHIGDHVVNDIDTPLKKGLKAAHIPKALDCFLRDEYKLGSKSCDALTKKLCGTFISFEKIEKSLGYRCMIAQCANKYFDNPYRSYRTDTILNQDSYFIGYYLVGMYLLGLNQWIEKIVTKGNYDTVYFTSRDGWMPMLAYNILREVKTELPPAEYFYTSRKAVLPAMIKNKLDFYDLPIDLARYTPQKLFFLLEFCTEKTEAEWKERCSARRIKYEECLNCAADMRMAVDLFMEEFYSAQKHQKAIEAIKPYYAKLSKKSIMFDMGYSGRIQEAISCLAGEEIDVMFVHSDAEKHDLLSRRGNFSIYSYFDFVPQMSDVLREYMLSSTSPSCIGYRNEEGKCVPVFDECDIDCEEREMIQKLQKGAQDFVQEFYDNFGALLEYVPYKSFEVSLPMEGFLRFGPTSDWEVFSVVKFEDVVYGGERDINLKGLIEMAEEWLPNYLDI